MVNHDEITDMSKHPGKAVNVSKVMWTDDVIETLITSYQPYDASWNMTIPDFKNQNKKTLYLEKIDEIMEEYGVSRTEYTAKWGTLRGQFLRDYNKHVRSKKSGAAADSVFRPTWKWYTHLQFLKTGEEVLNESIDTDIGLDESQNSSAVINQVNIRKTFSQQQKKIRAS